MLFSLKIWINSDNLTRKTEEAACKFPHMLFPWDNKWDSSPTENKRTLKTARLSFETTKGFFTLLFSYNKD